MSFENMTWIEITSNVNSRMRMMSVTVKRYVDCEYKTDDHGSAHFPS